PKYAGLDKVNPSSVILSGVLMLEHIGWREAADLITRSMEKTIQSKVVTYAFARLVDGATKVKCSEFADELIKNMKMAGKEDRSMNIQRHKISVIGSGVTGATTALMIGQDELAAVVLVDSAVMDKTTQGKALDMLEASPVQGFDASITGTANYEDTKDSDLVIITAGIARKPGMSRDDLVNTNAQIMKSVTKE